MTSKEWREAAIQSYKTAQRAARIGDQSAAAMMYAEAAAEASIAVAFAVGGSVEVSAT